MVVVVVVFLLERRVFRYVMCSSSVSVSATSCGDSCGDSCGAECVKSGDRDTAWRMLGSPVVVGSRSGSSSVSSSVSCGIVGCVGGGGCSVSVIGSVAGRMDSGCGRSFVSRSHCR